MPQIINTNIASLNAQRNLNTSQSANDTALSRLSSGLRINSAKDDAAGLAISTRFDAQIRGVGVATRNSGDGISLAQTAEGSLNAITSSLQRIRELALQSANDTNTAVDRDALDAEVQQLISEIGSISDNASFNGKKLLDGSFSGAQFQTGANIGENISFTISEATIDTLGSAQTNGISSFQINVGSETALVAGDVVINGVAVGASLSSADAASTTLAAQSAIAKADAINSVSDDSGVIAVTDANTAGGVNLVAAAASITLNGVNINVTTDTNLTDGANLVTAAAAINAVSGQTGVEAVVAADEDSGLTLIAADGRNIDLEAASSANTDAFGIGGEGVYTGSYTLISSDGSAVDVTSNTGDIDNAGLHTGEFSGSNSGVVGNAGSVSASSEGDLVINGVAVGATQASSDTASTTLAASSGISLAAAVNAVSENSGVSATTTETYLASTDVAVGVATIVINGTTSTVAAQADIGTQVTAIVDAVNAISGQTGVGAEVLDGNQYVLSAADGRNILTEAAANGGLAAVTTQSTVLLSGAGTIELTTNTGNIATNTGFEVGSYGGAASGTLLRNLDVTTVNGANAAITAVDNALSTVASQAAELGAIQSRFSSTISTLAVTQENLSAANSRIKDADFAAETAALSRSQVLQQAGISVLAQANGRPQQVLSLLQ